MRRRKRNTNFIDRVLYSQSNRKGVRVTVNRTTEGPFDDAAMEDGVVPITREAWEINAIFLPGNLDRRFVYDLSFIATNKNFTYGALFDTASRKILVRQKELNGWVPAIDDAILFDGKRWNLKQIVKFEYDVGYLLVGQEVEGAVKQALYLGKARDRLVFSETATSELN